MVCNNIFPSGGSTRCAIAKKLSYRSWPKCSKAPMLTIRSTVPSNSSQPASRTS
ncbi:Uncharacterised protein [Mycobacteroides abscessus subsp. abscessus]|nr:Uncharacterised protein [Mycobacteroides abscessus subsp. abscessus]